MKEFHIIVAVAGFVASLGQPSFAVSQQINSNSSNSGLNEMFESVTSSPFQMIFFPTQEVLNTVAINKAQHAIKTALLLSTSVTTNFVKVHEVDILLHSVIFQRDFEPLTPLSTFYSTTPASILEFKVQMAFVAESGEGSSTPSRFAMDNLIVRTFSQPSSKSSFMVSLGLARDPSLNDVLDIEIDIANESPATETVPKRRSLSSIDIFLIVASLFIFLGIGAVICFHHTNRLDEREIQPTNSSTQSKTPKHGNDADGIQLDASNSRESNTNKSFNSSRNNVQGVGLEENMDSSRASEANPFEGNIIEGSSLESSADGQSTLGFPAAESPDASFASSSTARHSNTDDASSASATSTSHPSSSSSSSSSSSPSDSGYESSGSEKEETSLSSQLLGASQPHYSDSSGASSRRTSDLAARLMNLSLVSTYDLSKGFNQFSSSSSAPPILERVAQEKISPDERKLDDKTVFSARSASSESFDSNHQVSGQSHLRGMKAFWMGQSLRETTQQFHNNWIESKKKALEDIEEGSAEDVFQIDIHKAGANEEERSKSSALTSSVSDWLKNIRVVESASETQSSVEHSSVEPRSSAKDNSSVDFSLEQSLAASIVEV